jgi:hypothetical protein
MYHNMYWYVSAKTIYRLFVLDCILIRYRSIHAQYKPTYIPNTHQYVLVCIEYIPIPPLRIGARIAARIVVRIGMYSISICLYTYQIRKKYVRNTYHYIRVCIEYIPIPPLRIGARIDARIEVCIGAYKVSICAYTYQIRR